MTSELQQNRYDRLIRRVGGIIGVGSKVSEVLTELFPMIDVEGDRGELQLLSGVVLGMGTGSRTADAGQRPRVQLFNPQNSGKLVTVTDVLMSTTVTQTMRVARTTIAEPNGITTQLARDLRQVITERPVGQMFTGSAVAQVDANIKIRVLSGVTFDLSPKNDLMILAPGTGINVGGEVIDSSITATFFWRERVAETSELNF